MLEMRVPGRRDKRRPKARWKDAIKRSLRWTRFAEEEEEVEAQGMATKETVIASP